MSVLAFGIHHRRAPLELLEDLALQPADLPKVLARMTDSADVREAVVLSTCQRIEVYATVARFHHAVQHVRDVLCQFSNRPAADLVAYADTWYDDDAAAHLFTVASGIDSFVVGESEVLAQVKQAASAAESEGTLGRVLRPLFRHAMEAAKRVRTETGISRSTASVASAALLLVLETTPVEGRPVAVIGAGQAAASAARALVSAGATDVVVVNRDEATGRSLAEHFSGRRVSFEHLGEVLRDVAVAICSTASSRPVITPALAGSVMSARDGRPLALVDIALPRDVHPDVAAVPGIRVVGLDDIRARADAGLSARRAEVTSGDRIVVDEVKRWLEARAMRSADPVVRALREQAEAVAGAELARRRGRLQGLSDAERGEVEALLRAVVRKLIHQPTAALRAHAADPDYEALVDAAAVLFDLEIE